MGKPVAIVFGVGAERGLGAALCRRFAAEGHHVFVAGRTAEKTEQVVHTIRQQGGSADSIAVDVTREEDVARAFDRAFVPGLGMEPADLVVYTQATIKSSTSASYQRSCSKTSGGLDASAGF